MPGERDKESRNRKIDETQKEERLRADPGPFDARQILAQRGRRRKRNRLRMPPEQHSSTQGEKESQAQADALQKANPRLCSAELGIAKQPQACQPKTE